MDLSTTYLGFDLPHPFIVGACPLADNLDSARALEDAGAAAIVMRSLFEEQLASEGLAAHRSMDAHAESFAEALTYFPDADAFALGPDEYLEHIQKLKEAVNVPVIASLNGVTAGGWLDYAQQIEKAGADALELHVYSVPTDPSSPGESLERRTIEMVRAVKDEVKIPVAVKLSPFYTSFANLAKQLDGAGADGLVLFNRFYQPDIDVEKLEVGSTLQLSSSAELPLRLRWLAIVSGRVRASLGVTGGVHTVLDAVQATMCGAQGIQMVSAVLQRGPECLKEIRDGLSRWLEENEYESLKQMQGNMSLLRCPDPNAFIRGNYMRVLQCWRDNGSA